MNQQVAAQLKSNDFAIGNAVAWQKQRPKPIPAMYATLVARQAPIGVVGLGYVGLPLACRLATCFDVFGFDTNLRRIEELQHGRDRTGEIDDPLTLAATGLAFSAVAADLATCPLIIVAVPTPVDDGRVPDLSPLISASRAVGKVMRPGTVVVFESTVYPGLTEEICGRYLAEASGLVCGRDFFLGYSPERINPGDRLHSIETSVKIVAGQTPEVTELLADVYASVIPAGVHRAPSIAAAEAAKIIENTQRDMNIALINELAMLFDRIGLDTNDVLDAARTKFNFMDVRPGLVGGHCISVDPYYLTHLAEKVGFHAQLIRAGRCVNESMADFIAQKTVRLVLKGRRPPAGRLRIAVLGVSFKENVPDLRNSKVPDIAARLECFGAIPYLVDPVVDAAEFEAEYGRKLSLWDEVPACDAVVLAVRHRIFATEYPLARLAEKFRADRVLVDVKGALDRVEAESLGFVIWRP